MTTGPADRLIAEHAQASALESALAADLRAIIESADRANSDDEHDPEGATIGFERAQIQSILEQTRGRLAELRQALQRLADGGYGQCERCGEPIPVERLEARPAASTCMGCASPRRR